MVYPARSSLTFRSEAKLVYLLIFGTLLVLKIVLLCEQFFIQIY